jgi:hypothetical protein
LYGAGTANNYLAGSLGIGTTILTGVNLYVVKAISGSTISTGIYQSGTVQSGVTSFAFGFNNTAILAASTTLGNYYHYSTDQSSFGAGATLTNQVGFFASGAMTSATNNYGFRGGLTNGTGRWNLYMDGTADNYLRGKLLINTTTVGTFDLDVNGTARVSGASTFNGIMTLESSSNYVFNIVNSGTSAASLSYSNASGAFYMGIDSVSGGAISGTSYSRLIWGQGNYPMVFATNNLERIRITNGGNVGIGTTLPAAKLHLVDSVESEIRTQYSTTSSGKLITGNGFTTIGSITNDRLVFVSNNTERMRLTNGGNFGIGTTSPYGKLEVRQSTTYDGIYVTEIAASRKTIGIWHNGTDGHIETTYLSAGSYTGLSLDTSGTPRIYITAGGNVGIGTTSPLYKLDVNGGIYGKGVTADSDGGVGNALYAYNQVLSGSSTNALIQLATTWNTTGNADAIVLDVTNTASGASSRLLDLKVGGSSIFKVQRNGRINASSLPTSATGLSSGDIWNDGGTLKIV